MNLYWKLNFAQALSMGELLILKLLITTSTPCGLNTDMNFSNLQSVIFPVIFLLILCSFQKVKF